MISLEKIESIYLWTGYIDMRKSFNGLIGLAESVVSKEEMGQKLFIFCGKRKNSIKVLEMDGDGWWLYQKKLVTGKFQWPKNANELMAIDKRQLLWLLDGLSPVQPKAHSCPLNFTNIS